MHPDDEIDWPKRITKDQRLYVCRPGGRDWREALMNYHAVENGGPEEDRWQVVGDGWRAGDLLLTYMQTSPMMIVHLDEFSAAATSTREIEWLYGCHFVHGVPLDLVNKRIGYRLEALSTFLNAPDARKVVGALKTEYNLGGSLFGSPRVAKALQSKVLPQP